MWDKCTTSVYPLSFSRYFGVTTVLRLHKHLPVKQRFVESLLSHKVDTRTTCHFKVLEAFFYYRHKIGAMEQQQWSFSVMGSPTQERHRLHRNNGIASSSHGRRRRTTMWTMVLFLSFLYIMFPDDLVRYTRRVLLEGTEKSGRRKYNAILVVGSSWGSSSSSSATSAAKRISSETSRNYKRKQQKLYPYLLSNALSTKYPPTMVHLTTTNNYWEYPSLCIFSMIRTNYKSVRDPYDVIVLEYPDENSHHHHHHHHHDDNEDRNHHFFRLAQRLRHRYPNAMIVILHVWYPFATTPAIQDPNKKHHHHHQHYNSSVPIMLERFAESIQAWVCELPRPMHTSSSSSSTHHHKEQQQEENKEDVHRDLKRLEAWHQYFHWDARHYSNAGNAAVAQLLLGRIQEKEQEEQHQDNNNNNNNNKKDAKLLGEKTTTTTTPQNTTASRSSSSHDAPQNDDSCNVWYETGWTHNHCNNNNFVSSSKTVRMQQIATNRYALELQRGGWKTIPKRSKATTTTTKSSLLLNPILSSQNTTRWTTMHWVEIHNPLLSLADVYIVYMASSHALYPACHVTLEKEYQHQNEGPSSSFATTTTIGVLVDPVLSPGRGRETTTTRIKRVGTLGPNVVSKIYLTPLQTKQQQPFRLVGIVLTPQPPPPSNHHNTTLSSS